jgi:hypothetical protein
LPAPVAHLGQYVHDEALEDGGVLLEDAVEQVGRER